MTILTDTEYVQLKKTINEQSYELGRLENQISLLKSVPIPKSIWDILTQSGETHTIRATYFEIVPGTNSVHFFNNSKDLVAYFADVIYIIRRDPE